MVLTLFRYDSIRTDHCLLWNKYRAAPRFTGLQECEPYLGGNRNNPSIKHTIPALLSLFRSLGKPVIHVKHDSVHADSPIHPSKPGNAIYPWAAPEGDEPVLTKNVHSSFIGTPLEALLRERGIARLVVCGLVTNHCVSTTVRMAENLGFEVILVGDACAAYERVGPDGVKRSAEDVHRHALSDLHGEFCTVVDTKDVAGLIV
ncbi:hypothetical protein ID866_10426 [Astraeus odoratus]|nr:hypothetical protein ID866_10426 [Astraeus odoratus]